MHHMTPEMSTEFLWVFVFTIINILTKLSKENLTDSKKLIFLNNVNFFLSYLII